MRATIDKAGRLVIPKPLGDQLGLRPGAVEVTADGAGLRVVPVHDEDLAEEAALVGATAAHHGLLLVTRDRRAADTYRALDVRFDLLE